jgi:hypothetical protein
VIPIFAEEFVIPSGFDNWLLNAMAVAVIVAAFIHIWKSVRTEPSIEKQLTKMREEVARQFSEKEKSRSRFRDEIYERFVTKEAMEKELLHLAVATKKRDELTDKFRGELRTDIHDIFDRLGALTSAQSFIDGRTRRDEK